MLKLVTNFSFVLCILVGNMSAVYSADRCNFLEAEKGVPDLDWIGGGASHLIEHKIESILAVLVFRFVHRTGST